MSGFIGTGALESRLTAIGHSQGFIRQLAVSVVAEQKRTVPRKTGNLGRSIHIESVSATGAKVIASANYAAFTEFGTRAHEIVPVNRKALRWAATSSGRRLSGSPRKGAAVIFAKRVRHPGTRGMHWAQRGAEAAAAKAGLADSMIRVWNGAA